jgi:hypothetical protein
MRFSLARFRWARLLPAAAAATLVGAAAAVGGVFAAGSPVRVPDNPLGASPTACSSLVARSTAAGSVNYPDAEVEPYVAADPAKPDHLVGAVQQDRWNDGGSNGLTAVYSTDGGSTWHLASSQPQVSICEGAAAGSAGYFDRATDPWVSFSADGKIVYLISDSFNANGPAFGGASSIIVSRSTDGGVTWQAPVTARLDASTTVLNDKETVTADPIAPNKAYAVWDRLVSPSQNANPSAFNHSPAFRGPVLFSKTTDGGVSWSNGRAVFDPGEKNQTIGNQIVVPSAGPAKGVLIDGFDLILTKGGKGHNQRATFSVAVIRSTDGGATWSKPVIVAQQNVGSVTIAGHPVRSSDQLPEFTVSPDGNLYAVWQEASFNAAGSSKIAFSESTDGGLHWTTPIRIDQSPGETPAFTPQMHVAADGTVGVVYYDLESATSAQPGLTDTFIVHCHAACADAASWTSGGETKVSTTGPFDMTQAPDAGGYFVGDYDGLTSFGTTFVPFYDVAAPLASTGATDTFSNTAG